MKIQKPFRYLLLLIGGGLAYLIVFIYQNSQRNKESFQWVTHTHEVLENITAIRSSVLDIESELSGYVVSGHQAFTQHYDAKKETLFRKINSLQKKTADNQEQQKHIAAILEMARRKDELHKKIFYHYQLSPQEAQALLASLESKRITDSIDTILQHMEAHEEKLLTRRMEHHNQSTQMHYSTTIVLALVAFMFLTILLIKIAGENRLRRLAEHNALLSEKKYKDLIENSALVVFSTNLEGNFTYLSGKCKDFTGFTPEELIGESYLTLVDENWRSDVQAFFLGQKEKQMFETVFEFPIRSKNGELRWLEQSTVLLHEGGAPVGFQCISKDITERKYAEKLLADAEQRIKAKQDEYQERLQAILNNMPMIVYLKDMEGRFMMVNRQFHQTFGTTDEEVIGQVELNVHKEAGGARRFLEADEQVKKTGKPVDIETVVRTTDGERDMLIVKFPLYDKQNELFAISAVGKDITEMVRYQRQLFNAKKRAEKAERLQEEFLANMSHEIRTPMNGIIGMTNLMETTPLNAEQKDYVHLIKESSGILLSLINDILDLSKIKSGRMTVENIDYDLHQTVESIIAPFRVKAKEKGIQVNKIFQDVPQHIRGDQHKLQQVLNNLLSNAVKFTEAGAVTLFATTEKREDGTLSFIFTVSDTGIGIAQENIEQVFDSFVQAGTDMVRRFGGTGLGLAITKRLIELQGGCIAVSSTLGEGTSFYVELPLELGENTSEPQDLSIAADDVSAHSLQGKRILLIEDNLVNQKVTYLMLHKAGMVVDIANHGKEAVELLEEKTYDLIITDLQMPYMDGFQTAAYIRNKLHLQVPIIAMTASALRNEKNRCLELGMNEYLSKPFAPASLFFHLRRLLNGEDKPAADMPEIAEKEKPEELYNLSFLAEMEDDEYTADVLEIFLASAPQTLLEIKDATFREQWNDVYRKAHSLKSSLGILQMNQLLHTVGQMETIAKNGTDTDNIEILLQSALQQYNLAKPMLEAELESTRKKIIL